MSELIDVFSSKKFFTGDSSEVIYSYVTKKVKSGKESIIARFAFKADLMHRLGWKHCDKIKVLTDGIVFKFSKSNEGFSLNFADKSRAQIVFSIKNLGMAFPREKQRIKKVDIIQENGIRIIQFSLKPAEFINPE